MRKSIFVFATNSIILGFLVLMILSNVNSSLYLSYPSVTVNEMSSEADITQLEKSLEELANRTDSIIARRVVTPTNQGTSFLYRIYGEGEVPPLFNEAGEDEAKNSNPANTYLILSGGLTIDELNMELFNFAETTVKDNRASPFITVLRFLASDAILLACVLFYLFYTSIIILSEIRVLRSSGIRMLSGITSKDLLHKNLRSSFLSIIFMCGLSLLVGSIAMKLLGIWNFQLFQLLIAATILHIIVLSFITFFITRLFSLLLKRTKLIDLVKGKLPVKSILTVLMISQFITLVVVSWSVDKVQAYLPEAQKLMVADSAWRERDNLNNISYNLGAFSYDEEESSRRNNLWFNFLVDALDDYDAIYARYVLRDSQMVYPGEQNYFDGKMLFVSPSYLDMEGTPVSSAFLENMNSLEKGQFGLLLPESMENSVEEITSITKEILWADYGLEDSADNLEAVVEFLPNGTEFFIYNQEAVPVDQWLQDIIVVVLTPHSVGGGTHSPDMWVNGVTNALFLQDADETLSLLKKHEIFPYASYVNNSYGLYRQQTENYRNETISLLLGSIIGMVTAIISFVAMNALYFSQFRREIFIHRISGESFLTIHKDYLRSLALVLLIAAIASFILTGNWLASLGSFIIFMGVEIFILSRQMKKESKMLVTVLKGE